MKSRPPVFLGQPGKASVPGEWNNREGADFSAPSVPAPTKDPSIRHLPQNSCREIGAGCRQGDQTVPTLLDRRDLFNR